MNVIAAIHQMSNEELNSVVEAVKLRRTALARGSVRKLSVGDLVRFTDRKGNSVRGSVIKLNQKTAVVGDGGGSLPACSQQCRQEESSASSAAL